MVMAMRNLCPFAGCFTGIAWNVGNSNQCLGGVCSYFARMDSIWNVLGDSSGNIAGQPRANVVRNTTWNMDGFGASTNPGVRSPGFNPPVTMRVNLPSYFEWKNGRDAGTGNANVSNTNCAPNSLGASFCYARYGTAACIGTGLGTDYYYPWLRSATSGDGGAWAIAGFSSVWTYFPSNADGLLPVIWISSSLTFYCGLGTYDHPFELDPIYCSSSVHNAFSNNNLFLLVGSFIGLDCHDSVNLEEIQSFGASTMQFYCSVLSNNATGYEIQISTVAMTNPSSSDTIVPMNDTPAVLNNPNVAQWGVTTYGSSVTVDDNVWIGSGIITSVNSPTQAFGNLHSYKVGASIGGNAMIEPGTYTGQITITASHI